MKGNITTRFGVMITEYGGSKPTSTPVVIFDGRAYGECSDEDLAEIKGLDPALWKLATAPRTSFPIDWCRDSLRIRFSDEKFYFAEIDPKNEFTYVGIRLNGAIVNGAPAADGDWYELWRHADGRELKVRPPGEVSDSSTINLNGDEYKSVNCFGQE
jgi:hypothetical protein